MDIKQTIVQVKKTHTEKKVNFSTRVKPAIKNDLDKICKTEKISKAGLLEAFVLMYNQDHQESK